MMLDFLMMRKYNFSTVDYLRLGRRIEGYVKVSVEILEYRCKYAFDTFDLSGSNRIVVTRLSDISDPRVGLIL